MKEDIKYLLEDYEAYHSRFQIENFIIGSKGNAWAKYKQCLREIRSRGNHIEDLKDQKELIRLDLKDLNRKKRLSIRRAKKNRISIQINSLKRKAVEVEESIHHSMRELIHFVNAAKRIRAESWGSGIITNSLKKELEAQMWREKAKQMLAVDIIAFGQLSKPTVEMLFSMPRKVRAELFKMIEPEKRAGLIEWAKK
jgi:hypothetical protein